MSGASRVLRQVGQGGPDESVLTPQSVIDERAQSLVRGADARERAAASLLKVAETEGGEDDEDDTGAAEVLDGLESVPRRVRRLRPRLRSLDGKRAQGPSASVRQGTEVAQTAEAGARRQRAAGRLGPKARTPADLPQRVPSGVSGVIRVSSVRDAGLMSGSEGGRLLRPSSAGVGMTREFGGTSVPPSWSRASVLADGCGFRPSDGDPHRTANGGDGGGGRHPPLLRPVSDEGTQLLRSDGARRASPVLHPTDHESLVSARYLPGGSYQAEGVVASEGLQAGSAALVGKGSETAMGPVVGAAGAVVVLVCILACVLFALAMSLSAILTTSLVEAQMCPEGIAACAVDAYQEGETRGDWWWRGERYRSLCGGAGDPWDAAFVCWCLAQCGLREEGLSPLVASTAELVAFYAANPAAGQVISHDGSYVPRAGDLLVSGLEGDDPRVSIIVEATECGLTCIEGDAAGGPRGLFDADADGIGGYVVARHVEPTESDAYIRIDFEGAS